MREFGKKRVSALSKPVVYAFNTGGSDLCFGLFLNDDRTLLAHEQWLCDSSGRDFLLSGDFRCTFKTCPLFAFVPCLNEMHSVEV